MTTRRCSRFEFSYRCSPFDFFVRVIAAVTGSYLLLHAFGITIPTILLSSLILFISLQPYAFVSFSTFDKAVHQAFNIFSIIFCISATFFLLTFSYRHYFSILPTNTAKNPCVQQSHSATTTPIEPREYPQNNCLPTEPTDAIDKIGNDALLAILSLVIVFAGFMSYVFLNLVKTNLHREITNAAHDERIASQIDISKSISFLYTEFCDFVKDGISSEPNESKNSRAGLNAYFEKALKEDVRGLNLFEKMNDEKNYLGLKLKVWNNYGFDICLQCEHQNRKPTTDERITLVNIRSLLNTYLTTLNHKQNLGYADIRTDDLRQLRDTYAHIDNFLSTN